MVLPSFAYGRRAHVTRRLFFFFFLGCCLFQTTTTAFRLLLLLLFLFPFLIFFDYHFIFKERNSFRKFFKRKLLVGCWSNVQIMSTISLLNGVVVVESIDDTAAEGPFHLNANSFWFVSENIYLKEKERERERRDEATFGKEKTGGRQLFCPKVVACRTRFGH